MTFVRLKQRRNALSLLKWDLNIFLSNSRKQPFVRSFKISSGNFSEKSKAKRLIFILKFIGIIDFPFTACREKKENYTIFSIIMLQKNVKSNNIEKIYIYLLNI